MNIEYILLNSKIPFTEKDSLKEVLLKNYDKVNLEDVFINNNCADYKCYDILKELLKKPEFRKMLVLGIINNDVRPFNDNLWEALNNLNYRDRSCTHIETLEEAFMKGRNLGNCTNFAKAIGYVFETSKHGEETEICGGIVPLLKGTVNCPEGNHTWMEYGGLIYDTSLMIIMTNEFSKKLGYVEENRYYLSQSVGYEATKEFVYDKSFRDAISKGR
jgi:hypothetical protein